MAQKRLFSTKNLLTQKNIFSRTDSYNIFSGYCEPFKKVGVSFISDLPNRAKKDTNASCRIEFIGGDLLYTDFGEGSYYVIQYVMRKFGLEYRDVLRKINADFNLGLIDEDTRPIKTTPGINVLTRTPVFKEKSTTIIQVKYADFTEEDLDYWKGFGWDAPMLTTSGIKAIDYFWLTMHHKNIDNAAFCVEGELAYTFDYYHNNGTFRRKLYFPDQLHDRRFLSNVDDTIVQNWPSLPKDGGDLLVITKSLKDCGPFMKLGHHAIAPNNEKVFIPDEVYYKKLLPKWNNIVLWWDNDAVGLRYGTQFGKKYGLQAIFNPPNAPKDPSDFWKEYGGNEFNYLLKSLVK